MTDEVPAKRLRHSVDRSPAVERHVYHPQEQVFKPAGKPRVFGAELVIYDRHRRCLLTDGDYELVLKELGQPESPKKQATWETVMDGKVTCKP